MPAMPRSKSLATKIAYAILGTPSNIAYKRSQSQEVVNQKLTAQESSRVR